MQPERGHPPEGWSDDFVVLNANRNQPFKRIDIALEGFALFAKDKPESVMLYLHMARRTAPGEVPLADLFNIRPRIPTTTREESHPHVDDGALNTIYNACDVGMNTSEKEGWGLIAFEHGATRSPQVVPNHGACTELGQRSALLLDTAGEREPTAMPCCGQKRYPASRSAKVGARISLGRSCASVK